MGDGVLAFVENFSIKLVDLKTNSTNDFVSFSDIRTVCDFNHATNFLVLINRLYIEGEWHATYCIRLASLLRRKILTHKNRLQKGNFNTLL